MYRNKYILVIIHLMMLIKPCVRCMVLTEDMQHHDRFHARMMLDSWKSQMEVFVSE